MDESRHHLGGDGVDALVQVPRVMTHEVAHQQRDILEPRLQKGPLLAAVSVAGAVGGLPEVFQTETVGRELKQLDE